MNDNIVVGIDIGGSHITAALVDLKAHALISKSLIRRHVNSKDEAIKIIKEWTGAIANCKAYNSSTSNKIGIAMPGPFDYEKGISFIKGLDKYDALYKLNVKHLIANELGITKEDIFLMNDASCFLKGEVFGGAARDQNSVIGITLGTGLGSAFYKDGVVYDGDLYCTNYKDSTAEEYLSTRWFIKRYHQQTGKNVNNVKEIRDGIPSDLIATAIFKEFGKNLGEVLAMYIKRHNAGYVVVGGNIIHAWHLFMPETMSVLQDHNVNIPLVKAQLGEDAALLGAGSLCT